MVFIIKLKSKIGNHNHFINIISTCVADIELLVCFDDEKKTTRWCKRWEFAHTIALISFFVSLFYLSCWWMCNSCVVHQWKLCMRALAIGPQSIAKNRLCVCEFVFVAHSCFLLSHHAHLTRKTPSDDHVGLLLGN